MLDVHWGSLWRWQDDEETETGCPRQCQSSTVVAEWIHADRREFGSSNGLKPSRSVVAAVCDLKHCSVGWHTLYLAEFFGRRRRLRKPGSLSI